MKLFCCHICSEVFNLSHDYKECAGKHGGGQYIDGLNAKVWGQPGRYSVLGFANSSFIGAIQDQVTLGDSKEMMGYAGKLVAKGRNFTAFIIPESADSVRRYTEKYVGAK